jgi:hypothetical protein
VTRRVHAPHRRRTVDCGRRRRRRWRRRQSRDGDLDVRGIVAAVARDDRVFTRVDEHLKLGARRPADRPRVRLHHPIREAHAIENSDVCFTHFFVARARAVFGRVERVRVFHHELAAAEQAPTRPRLVAELKLNLVESLRKVAPAAELAARDVGDDLLVRRAEVVIGRLPISDAKKDVAVELPAACLFEVVGREQRWHEELERTRAVHFGTDDRLDFAQNTEPERQKIVDSGADSANVSRARKEHVARIRRVGRSLFHRGDKGARQQHRASAASSTRAENRTCSEARGGA